MAAINHTHHMFCQRTFQEVPVGLFRGNSSQSLIVHGDVMAQVGLFTLLASALQFLLRPLKQPAFVPQILVGIALGPSGLGRDENLRKRFNPPASVMVMDIYAVVGFVFFVFLVGMKTDIFLIKKAGKMAYVVGVSAFLFPLAVTLPISHILRRRFRLETDFFAALPYVGAYECIIAFHVMSAFLTELKLLNSELGRLALSSSMISGTLGWCLAMFSIYHKNKEASNSRIADVEAQICNVFMILTFVFVFRPILFWMMKKTPEGKALKEHFFLSIVMMVLGTTLFSVFTGNHLLGPILLGLLVPEGPPMGSSLLDKLGYIQSVLLFPCYVISIGRKFNLSVLRHEAVVNVSVLIVIATLGKLLAVMIPSLYYNMPLRDSLSLGLLLNCQGFFDIYIYERALYFKLITRDCFGVMVVGAMVHTAIFMPLVRILYDPSRRYVAYKRRTIQHLPENVELRILTCIHEEEEDVAPIINLLQDSNPNYESPIGVYVLDLMELMGRSVPTLIAHPPDKPLSSKPTRTDRILNAFHKFGSRNEGSVSVQCFTAIAPYATMHDDVCSLALERSTTLVIVPFQKSYRPPIRAVNRSVLQMAPCSVGVLVIRNTSLENKSVPFVCRISLGVCLIFFGGADDREALSYASRMAGHPAAKLTVVRIYSLGNPTGEDLVEKRTDLNAINEFKIKTYDSRRVTYKEIGAKDATDTAAAVGKLNDQSFDLILVGRRHDEDSVLFRGFSEWSELPELGVVGDMLVSSDFKTTASVLIMQQQASVVDEMLRSPKFLPRVQPDHSLPK
uniref:Cation/H+ exchanger domain-containing protein n=1 Tax=Kalanchoe fedtschenkoi TaxID=63787 RepID=A0A7N0T331_KALFE